MTTPLIPKSKLLAELSAFAKPSNVVGLALLARDYVLYFSFLALLLFAESLGVKIFASLMMGFRLSSFYTLAHDASHSALVKSKRLNWYIAMLFGLPATHNYRMWTQDHNFVHHPFTNRDHFDYYTPLSKIQYDQLPWHKRLLERVYRSPTGIGLLVYFLVHWFPTRIWPNVRTPKSQVGTSIKYSLALFVYHSLFVTFLVKATEFAPITVTEAIVLGWLLPILLLMFFTSLSLYLMHTHPNVPWFRAEQLAAMKHRPELVSVVVRLPKFVSMLVNNVYSHAAHHAHAGIPTYKLYSAQTRMDSLMGDYLTYVHPSFSEISNILKSCKLYDYEKHQWLDFEGNPTSSKIDLKARGFV